MADFFSDYYLGEGAEGTGYVTDSDDDVVMEGSSGESDSNEDVVMESSSGESDSDEDVVVDGSSGESDSDGGVVVGDSDGGPDNNEGAEEEEEEVQANESECVEFAMTYARACDQDEQEAMRALMAEWEQLDGKSLQNITKCIGQIMKIEKITVEAEQKVNNFKLEIGKHSTKHAARLGFLCLYNDALTEGVHAYTRMIDIADDFAKALKNRDEGSFRASINWHVDLGRSKQKTMEGEQRRSQYEELYPLQRNTPGRKGECNLAADAREELRPALIELAKKIPMMPAIVHPARQGIRPRWISSPIANNGGGNAGIFVRVGVDANQTIVERLLCKDLRMAHKSDPYSWRGDPAADVEKDQPLPQEYVAQRLMGQPDAHFVVKIFRKLKFDEQTMMARIYMEYAHHGDLGTVLSEHKKANTPVPGEFLWLLFKALIETVFIMKHGSLDEDKTPSDWLQIVHRDLKPPNVLLSFIHSTHFSMFPRPKVADYGLCLLTNKDDECNPYMHSTQGTLGFFAPEQRLFSDPETGNFVDDFKMLSPCNVWGIGLLMYDLMVLNDLDDPTGDYGRAEQLPYLVAASGPTGKEFEFDVKAHLAARWTGTQYDKTMIMMVEKCMKFSPEERMSIEHLKHYVDQMFQKVSHLGQLANGLKPTAQQPSPLLHAPEVEKYRLGLAYQSM